MISCLFLVCFFTCLVVDLWSVVFGMCRVYHSVSLNPACRQATRLGTHRSNPHIDTFVFGPLLQSQNQVGFGVVNESSFSYETIARIHTLRWYIDFRTLLLLIVRGTWLDLRWDQWVSFSQELQAFISITIGIQKQELLNQWQPFVFTLYRLLPSSSNLSMGALTD